MLPTLDPIDLPLEAEASRHEVRAFLREHPPERDPHLQAQSWQGVDRAFSKALGARGWIGMTWPKRYGGGERSAFDRYVVSEELLAAGAPVGAHWIADRQSGPLLLRHGTEDQRRAILPGICRGETIFCIGMSEPGSGSDLASLRTRAEKRGDRWVIDGQKVWTTNAAEADWMIALVRTSEAVEGRKHEGLSQMLIDMRSPGITVRPIRDMAGHSHFNEVFFAGVEVPADRLLGREGGGWAQVVSELALERSGPERFLTSLPLLTAYAREVALNPHKDTDADHFLATRLADLITLRTLSTAVAGDLVAGRDPVVPAAIVKDLGATFEQSLILEVADRMDWTYLQASGRAEATLVEGLALTAPSFSLRGGTREILRGIIAKGLGAGGRS
jgi:alkylation response protein AidB-like acyl-CoA dehydrogenase